MDKIDWLKKIRVAKRIEKFSSIIKYCEGKTVLDVGCIGQDHSTNDSTWLHGNLKSKANKLVGVDINTAKIEELNSKGFEIYTPENLPKEQKFDVIVMGDVIEHVNDPGSFLEFYSPSLSENGIMIICTPNSFGVRYSLQVLIYGTPGTNPEHTLSFDPYVMLELFGRINLVPTEFYWLKEYHSGANIKQKIILKMSEIFIFLRSFFNSNFMYIVSKK